MSAPMSASIGTGGQFAVEQLSPDFGFYLKNSQLLVSKRSVWQHIEVFENAQFGRVMRIVHF